MRCLQALQLFHDQLDRWMKARVAAIQKRAGDFGRGEFARRLREEVQAAKGELRCGRLPGVAARGGCEQLPREGR